MEGNNTDFHRGERVGSGRFPAMGLVLMVAVMTLAACDSRSGANSDATVHSRLLSALGVQSDWLLTLRPREPKDGKGPTVRIFSSAPPEGVDPRSAGLGTQQSLQYRLHVEVADGRLRRCQARDEKDYVTTECRLKDGRFVIFVGRKEAGRFLFDVSPDADGDGSVWKGTAKMEHPSLPMDVEVGTARMTRAE